MVEAWNRFWFRPADPTPLGVIRIVTGLLVLYVHLAYTVDLQELFGPHAWIDAQGIDKVRHEVPLQFRGSKWDESLTPYRGEKTAADKEYMREWENFHPRQVPAKGIYSWSIWFHVTDPTWIAVVHGGILAILVLFTLGVATRVTSVLAWLGTVSYIQRAPTTLFGMDTMMNLLMLYLMIGPSGAALSVDRLIARYWVTRRALRAGRPAPSLNPAPLVSANLAIRLLQVNLCIVYLASGLSKRGPSWWNGTAVWGTLANYEFSPMHFAPYLAFLRFLSENRWLWEIFITGGVVFTLFLEISFAFLIWVRPLRWVMLTMAVMMHTGIAIFMGLNTFSLMMMGLLLSFVPLDTIHWLLRSLGRNAPRFTLAFNGRERTQVRAASLVRAFDFWDQVELREHATPRRIRVDAETPSSGPNIPMAPNQRPDSVVEEGPPLQLATESGAIVTGSTVFERLAHSVRGLWPLVPVAKLIRMTGGNGRHRAGTGAPGAFAHTDNNKRHTQGERVTH
jgi:hypothetical protein